MSIKPRYTYDATDIAVDPIPEHRIATLTFLTTGEIDLSLILPRDLLVRLRSQIDAAVAALPPLSQPTK